MTQWNRIPDPQKVIEVAEKKFTRDDEREMAHIMQSSPLIHNIIMMYSQPIIEHTRRINEKLEDIMSNQQEISKRLDSIEINQRLDSIEKKTK